MAPKRVTKKASLLIFIIIVILLLQLMVFYHLPNHREKSSGLEDEISRTVFEKLLDGPLMPDDPSLIYEIRNRYLHHPPVTQGGPNLETGDIGSEYREHFSYSFYRGISEELFENGEVRNGFFIEAGALDGEYASNTLPIEKLLNWTGLLVEPDRGMFKRLLKMKRNCWAANICLAPHPYPHKATMMILSQASSSKGEIKMKSMNSLVGDATDDRESFGYSTYEEVHCFPTESLLLALSVTNITLFSLDVEALEWPILRHFPFNTVTVEVWMVEHQWAGENGTTHPAVYHPEFVEWFEHRNYRLFAYQESHVVDYVFVHRNSIYNKKTHKTSQTSMNTATEMLMSHEPE